MLLWSKQLGRGSGFLLQVAMSLFSPSVLLTEVLDTTSSGQPVNSVTSVFRVNTGSYLFGHARVDHSASECTCKWVSLAHLESIRAGLWLLPRVTKALIPGKTHLKNALGNSWCTGGEYMWNEWVCCLLETPVNRSGFACSPTFVLSSFPTVFIWKQIQIIFQVIFISPPATLEIYLLRKKNPAFKVAS